MAKIEQCERCRRYKRGTYEMKCSWFGVKPDYNDIECENFEDKDGRNNNNIKKKDIKNKEKDKKQQIIQSKGEAYKIAHNMLINSNKIEQDVIDELVRRGMTTDDAESVVCDVKLRAKKYKRQILFGILLCIISLILLSVLFSHLENGIVNAGVILFVIGMIMIIVACIKMKRLNWEGYEPTLSLETSQNMEANNSRDNSFHECVDLGLPSGTLWATCNVGANRPEGYGKYYAWGSAMAKNEYDVEMLDANNIDTAAAIWGGKWRMPTDEECNELILNCTKEWVKQNGVNGCRFTGSNGNSIFMPAAGYYGIVTAKTYDRYRSYEAVIDEGKLGYYWTSSSRAFDICYMYFDSESCDTSFSENSNNECRMVRPVCK